MSARAPRPDPIASPPDDGGHQGSFSLPQDQLDVNPHGESRHPELHRDPTYPPPSRRGSRTVTWTLVLLLLAGIVLWQYCGAAEPQGTPGSAPSRGDSSPRRIAPIDDVQAVSTSIVSMPIPGSPRSSASVAPQSGQSNT